MFSTPLRCLLAAGFLFSAAPGTLSASENLFLKGTVNSTDVMVRLSAADAGEKLPGVFGALDNGPYAYYGAYYKTADGNGIETYLVAHISPDDQNTLKLYPVIDGKRSETPWSFAFRNVRELSRENEWKGTYGSSGEAVLHLWEANWEDAPELNDDYNAPRIDAALKAEKENGPAEFVFATTGIRYSIVEEKLAGTAYPRLVDYPDNDIMKAVNEMMDSLQRNLMKYHLACMANGRSTPGKVENRTSMELLTSSILSASMHYKYTDPNPDIDCSDFMFSDPLNIALLASSMEAGEILGLEDMFTEKALSTRVLQQYAWKMFSREYPDKAEDCRNDFRNNPDAISLTFTETGAIFELSLDNDRVHCTAPVRIEGSFLRRMVLEGSPLESLWKH